MKKIFLRVMTIALVSGFVFAVTSASFNDTEEAKTTFSTGSIDIAVDGTNPWTRTLPYEMKDMKPSQVGYSNFIITNVGTNPANVYKKLSAYQLSDVTTTEPECKAEGGSWPSPTGPCTGNTQVMDLDSVIDYDLSVVVKNITGKIFEQTLYNQNEVLHNLEDKSVLLGMIPAGGTMEVTESYHLRDSGDSDNRYQTDTLAFDIVLTAEQLKGVLVLEDKDANWVIQSGNDIKGTLTYDVKEATFDFSFSGKAPLATNYSLIMYEEAFSTPAHNDWPRNVIVLGTASSDGSGNIIIPATSLNLNQDILNMKIWLVPSSDLDGNTLKTFDRPAFLFDTSLMDYYDSSL